LNVSAAVALVVEIQEATHLAVLVEVEAQP
jgi:hypothetical protein